MNIFKKVISILLMVNFFYIVVPVPTFASDEVSEKSGFTFTDDFSGYEPGSYGSPNWMSKETSWKINNGYFINDFNHRSFVHLNSPIGSDMVIESEVMVEKSLETSYKVTGLSVYSDDKNYWHLALAESPEASNNRHYVELVEMLNGKWFAQDTGATKLKAGASFGNDFKWEYGHPYLLRITIKGKGIIGAVYDQDGTLKWQKEYLFASENCISKGIPSLTSYDFVTKFNNFKVSINKAVDKDIKQYPAFNVKTNPSIKGKQTGFFHTEKINDAWWIIAPDGNSFYAIGTGEITYSGVYSQTLGYAPYGKSTEQIYGSEEKWAGSMPIRLKDWGFNLLGKDSSPSLRYRGLAHTKSLYFTNMFCKAEGDTAIVLPNKDNLGGFPNVFNTSFNSFCDSRAKLVIQDEQNDPWLLGYYLENEQAWWGNDKDTSYGLTDVVIEKDKTHSSKMALMNWLKNKYSKIDDLNKAWGTNYVSYEALEKLHSFTGKNQSAINDDKIDFEKIIIEKYFSITTEAIRKYDPNHMILGCRDEAAYHPWYDLVWSLGGKYIDVSSINYYGYVDLAKEVVTPSLTKDINKLYAISNTPIMISEWSFPAYDSGLPCTYGAGMKVNTQIERAKAFEIYQKALFSSPYLVGSEFFRWSDPPATGYSSTDSTNSNYGLVDVKDKPYALLTNTAKEVNGLVYDLRDKGNVTGTTGITAGTVSIAQKDS